MKQPELLLPENVCLHIVDVQQSLMSKIHRADAVEKTIALLVNCCRVLNVPIIANTQYKKGLGPYVAAIEALLKDVEPIDKTEFSAAKNEQTAAAVRALPEHVHTIVLTGVETHICIYQTAVGLMESGKNVWIVSDGVSARNREDHKVGIRRLERLGAVVGSAEMLIYELLGKAGTPQFKMILPYITGTR